MRGNLCLLILFMALAVICGGASPTQAQTAPSSDLNVLDRQLRTPPAPKSEPRPRVTEDESGEPRFDQSLRFTLGSLAIDGANVLSPDELLAPYAHLYGTSVSFNDILRITEEMSVKYREAGYILSRVALPAQEAEPASAHIRLRAVEGYLTEIRFEGEETLRQRAESYFSGQARKLLSQKPLRHKDYERALLLLRDAPGLNVSSTFAPADKFGGTVLVVTVERDIIDGQIGWGNTGTESSGPGMISAGLGFSSAPFIGGRTSLNYTQADDYREYYNISLGQSYQLANGLSFNASYAYSESQRPDTEFARLFDHATESHTFSFGLDYALIRSRDMNLSLGTAFNLRNSEAELFDAPYTRDRLRSLVFSANFDFAEESGAVTQLMPSFTQGLKAGGATDQDVESSSPLAKADYSKVNLYVARNQPLFGSLSLMFTGEVQLAGTVLPSYEQFSLGGGAFGRGYDPGALESDNGAAASAELRWTYQLEEPVNIQPYVFIDGGTVWTKGNIAGVDPHADLSSAGIGLRFSGRLEERFVSGFSLNAFMAKPLKTVYGESSPRCVLSFNFMF